MANLPPNTAPALVLGRAEIEAGQIGRALDDLMHLSDNSANVRLHCQTLRLELSPWPNEDRRLSEISAVRHFMQQLDDQWPYWMHFLRADPAQWRLLLDCILSPRPLALHERPGKARFHDRDYNAFITRHVDAMKALHAAHGFTEAQTEGIYLAAFGALREAAA